MAEKNRLQSKVSPPKPATESILGEKVDNQIAKLVAEFLRKKVAVGGISGAESLKGLSRAERKAHPSSLWIIPRRVGWPVLQDIVEEALATVDQSLIPPWQVLLEIVDPVFQRFELEMEPEDALFATAMLANTAQQYLLSLQWERERLKASSAQARLRGVAKTALELRDLVAALDRREREPMARKVFDHEPGVMSLDVAGLLATAILANRGYERAKLAIAPAPPEPDPAATHNLELFEECRGVLDEVSLCLTELHLAATLAAGLPLGEEELLAWPMLRTPKSSLRAAERAVGEITTMFELMIGELPSRSRIRGDPGERDAGPLVTPMDQFFLWLRALTGEPAPSPSTIENALRRIASRPE